METARQSNQKQKRDISERILRSLDKWMSEYTTKECLWDNMEEITVLRSNGQNPQTKWKKVKENIKETAIKITEEERTKANRLIKNLKRDMETQNKRTTSSDVTEENRKRAKEEFLFLKSSLNKIGNKKVERAKDSAQAQFLNEGERCSKYWFALNKPKEPSNIILGLQNEEGIIQTETRKMVAITSEYHRQLQEKPPMNAARRNAITKIKNMLKKNSMLQT